MTEIRYILARRFKHQKNRKWNNLTEADFRYNWGYPNEHHIFRQTCDNAFDCFDSLDKVHKEVTEHPDEYPYGYKVFKLEKIEEVKVDKEYQPEEA